MESWLYLHLEINFTSEVLGRHRYDINFTKLKFYRSHFILIILINVIIRSVSLSHLPARAHPLPLLARRFSSLRREAHAPEAWPQKRPGLQAWRTEAWSQLDLANSEARLSTSFTVTWTLGRLFLKLMVGMPTPIGWSNREMIAHYPTAHHSKNSTL